MKIGLIGCGRLGLTIGYFLRKYKCLYGVYDTDKKKIKYAVKILKISDNPGYEKLIKNCQVLLFATPDDRILDAYNRAKKHFTDKKFLFHFSGLLPAEVFAENKNVFCAALHPFATFPYPRIPPLRKKYDLFFQGDKKSYRIALRIFPRKHFRIHTITKKHKPFYHLLGVFSSNMVVALIEAILYLSRKLAWRKKDFNDFIFPMMIETIMNVKKYGVKKGLSGPLVRGDVESIKKHLKILEKNPALHNIYRSLSQIILKYAPAKEQRQFKKILNLD
ncbi:MAG: DUF2520 domain-containing protein [bacterium]